jgi:hypothetical protein
MNNNRIAKSFVVAVAFASLFAVSAMAGAQGVHSSVVQASYASSHEIQSKGDSLPPDDFAGLSYTEEQKSELDKIHRETESNKAAVARDEKLNADQKNAMLLGYTRMEYGRTFKVLSPEQQRQVRQRILARRAADQAAHKQQPPRN